jgi:hypothetical protein
VLGEDSELANEDETVNDIPPSFVFVLFPLIFSFIGGLILFWTLVTLPIYYNYLRGCQSPLDRYILALLGSDLSRGAVLLCAVIGIIIGSFLARFVTKKIDAVKKEGEVILSTKMYLFAFFWWQCASVPQAIISLIEINLVGFYTSWFLRDISFALMCGYFVSFGVPVLFKYFYLLWYANSIDSQVKLVGVRGGTGRIKPVRWTVMKIIPIGPST